MNNIFQTSIELAKLRLGVIPMSPPSIQKGKDTSKLKKSNLFKNK
jgi:hypothetical protein